MPHAPQSRALRVTVTGPAWRRGTAIGEERKGKREREGGKERGKKEKGRRGEEREDRERPVGWRRSDGCRPSTACLMPVVPCSLFRVPGVPLPVSTLPCSIQGQAFRIEFRLEFRV